MYKIQNLYTIQDDGHRIECTKSKTNILHITQKSKTVVKIKTKDGK